MGEFYTKNKKGEYLPVELVQIFGKDLSGHLVVVRVGSDEHPASARDLDETVDSFNNADFLKGLDNLSIVITPFQIDVDVFPKEDLGGKSIFLQITSGQDVAMLEEQIRKIYNNIKKKHETIVVPTPLKVSEYRQAQDILKRCQIRKERRGNKAR
jgi:hypothetical protein